MAQLECELIGHGSSVSAPERKAIELNRAARDLDPW